MPCRVTSWLLVAVVLAAAAGPAPARDADDEPFLPGLVGTYRDGKGNTATRVDPQLAFHGGDTAPDPRLAAGELQVTWTGSLYVENRGEHRFALYGTGEVELKVGGRVAAPRRTLRQEWYEPPPVVLAAEYQPLELHFRQTEKEARLAVLWSGPQFSLEPIPPRFLLHARERTPGPAFERGRLLARTLRCDHCHAAEHTSRPAPALDRLAGNLSRDWLVQWLANGAHAPAATAPRRMPSFGLTPAQAEAVADWLLASGAAACAEPQPAAVEKPAKKAAAKGKPKPPPDPRTGERLFVALGCPACHTWRDLGASGWLGGGDLTHVAAKRPPGFFTAWLADPARLNTDHRMPVFTLGADERASLALFLAEQKPQGTPAAAATAPAPERRAEGRKLVEQLRCAACHRLPGQDPALAPPAAPPLGRERDWSRSCLEEPEPARQRPGYGLSAEDAQAVRAYYSALPAAPRPVARRDGRDVLVEHNCLACHAREGTREAIPLLPPLLADKLVAVAGRYTDLAPQIPALTPPALNSVGDKLHDQALHDAIARQGPPHRPYLQVRMPRFPLRPDELQSLVQYLTVADRVPPRPEHAPPPLAGDAEDRAILAGGRLVSSDGFGCTSCHQVGSVEPVQAQLNARGPDLSQLGSRIRQAWFDRWLRNPARIVPRMEMPSVQVPVSGVLGDRLDDQVAAVWHVLNLRGFEPPPPNPVRTLRHLGSRPDATPLLVTDVLEEGKTIRVKPFLVGLANRHNVLLDLETAALVRWTAGDTARQRTRGKTWFWEGAGAAVLDTGLAEPDLALVRAGRALAPRLLGQFVTEADAWQTQGAALALEYRLAFDGALLHVRRTWSPLPASGGRTGFAQELLVEQVPAGSTLRLRLVGGQAAGRATRTPEGRTLRLGDRFGSRIEVVEPAGGTFSDEGLVLTPDAGGRVRAVLRYATEMPVDRFPELPAPPAEVGKPVAVQVAPGFTGERLPLAPEIMPTGLAWRPDGRLVFSSLKGQVFEALDSDRDGSEDRLVPLVDGLPAPYGVHAEADHVDVAAKYAVLRLGPTPGRVEAVASGWGYTPDYHDWAVGLPRTARDEYLLGIPCQQDRRAPAAARFHGTVLRLVPRTPTRDEPRRFTLVPLSAGHRFPMGLALDPAGELFVTDNQGNYNPFNELNHVRPGVHFGFINALDRDRPAPPLTPPAIDIPHPWTRSVNGICFLTTPPALRAQLGRPLFGPLEGQLVGCEYDTRRLVRLSLQRVGDTFQGAAYPLSIPPGDPAQGLLGPVVCAVSPAGHLYIGGIRDSGWGAGNNIGEIVRVRVEPEKLSCGIAEVRASATGFTLTFTQPVDRAAAARPESYTVQSYRRIATPAYGGPDVDRRTEKLTAVTVALDSRRVTLRLAELRPGFVYELRLGNLAPDGGDFHPAEAHYTLRVIPQ